MGLQQLSTRAKPAQHRFAAQPRGGRRGERVIRGELPSAKIVNQPMALGILVDIGNESAKSARWT